MVLYAYDHANISFIQTQVNHVGATGLGVLFRYARHEW